MGSFMSSGEDEVKDVLFVKPFKIREGENKTMENTITITLTPHFVIKPDYADYNFTDEELKDPSIYQVRFDINPPSELVFSQLIQKYPKETAHVVICSIKVGKCVNPYQFNFGLNIINLIPINKQHHHYIEKEIVKENGNKKNSSKPLLDANIDKQHHNHTSTSSKISLLKNNNNDKKKGTPGSKERKSKNNKIKRTPVKTIPDQSVIDLSDKSTSHKIVFILPAECNDDLAEPVYSLPLRMDTIQRYAGVTLKSLNKGIMKAGDWEILPHNSFMFQFIDQNFICFVEENIKKDTVIKQIPPTELRKVISAVNTHSLLSSAETKIIDDQNKEITISSEKKTDSSSLSDDYHIIGGSNANQLGGLNQPEPTDSLLTMKGGTSSNNYNNENITAENIKQIRKVAGSITPKILISNDERKNLRMIKQYICDNARQTLYDDILKHISYANLTEAYIQVSSKPNHINTLIKKYLDKEITSPIVINLHIKYVVTLLTVEEKRDVDYF